MVIKPNKIDLTGVVPTDGPSAPAHPPGLRMEPPPGPRTPKPPNFPPPPPVPKAGGAPPWKQVRQEFHNTNGPLADAAEEVQLEEGTAAYEAAANMQSRDEVM